MRKLPLGIQNFRKIREGNYVYVDKTEYIYDLINNASYYFLSRPRRFGKSLLIDTIEETFSGERELFKGLFIYNSDYDFEKHPVLRLDMSRMSNKSPEALENSLASYLKKRVKEESLDIDDELPSDILQYLIEGLHDKYGKRVVILIDEYDKPILDHMDDIDVAEANRKVLRGFYGILKPMDSHIRLAFITGVSKFTKTSIFSELNNLYDITMTERYSSICGIAIEEMDMYFGEHIKYLASLEAFERYDNLQDEILAWYDGYSWDGKSRVINPFSLLSFLMQRRFAGFWYASGTPDFFIKLIKQKPSSFLSLNDLEISERALDNFDIRKMNISPLLFQTGYLTVDSTRFRGDSLSYLLKMPNLEVREAFYLNIIAEFTETGDDFAESAYWRIKESLETGDLNGMLGVLKSLFASIPYELHVKREAYYHSIFYAVLNLLGFDVKAEVSVSGGRVDAVLELDDKVYIMEFKYRDCETPPLGIRDVYLKAKQELYTEALNEGLAQIKDRGYSRKYGGSGKTIYQVAFVFLGRDDIEMLFEI